ncbi:MAG: type IV pilus secretin PilQ [Candidatus Binatia bacterium]
MTLPRLATLRALLALGLLVSAAHAQFPRGNVSLDLRNADIRDVIWAFAKEHELNVIIGEDVKGNVTLSLRNVPIPTAFHSILDNAGLGYTQSGNILRVNTLETIKAKKAIEPLVTRIVTLNYFTSRFGQMGISGGNVGGGSGGGEGDDLKQLQESLKAHLSGTDGSSITMIPRTNSLVITDIASNVDHLVQMVKQLDVRTPQVLIEAKIVEVDAGDSRDLGITTRLNAQRTRNTEFGGGTGASFPAQGVTVGSGTPGAIGISPGASAFDFFLNSLGGSDTTNLQIVLSAAEANGLAKTLATPRVTTLHNKEAIISSGQRIPFTTLGSIQEQGGTNLVATVQFVDAALELAVTPHVTGDGTILMKIRATRNSADFDSRVFDNPTISTREARNEVLVGDGDTIVIGGIYIDDSSRDRSGTPFLQDIPVLGHLFKRTARTHDTMELIFLITPRVVHDPALIRPVASSVGGAPGGSLALEGTAR